MQPPATKKEQSNPPDQQSKFSELVKESTTKSNAIQIPQISLPKGGGALKDPEPEFFASKAPPPNKHLGTAASHSFPTL